MEPGLTNMDMLVASITAMDRGQLITTLREMQCVFPLDFTDEFLGTISLERLRHITLAASLHKLKACA